MNSTASAATLDALVDAIADDATIATLNAGTHTTVRITLRSTTYVLRTTGPDDWTLVHVSNSGNVTGTGCGQITDGNVLDQLGMAVA